MQSAAPKMRRQKGSSSATRNYILRFIPRSLMREAISTNLQGALDCTTYDALMHCLNNHIAQSSYRFAPHHLSLHYHSSSPKISGRADNTEHTKSDQSEARSVWLALCSPASPLHAFLLCLLTGRQTDARNAWHRVIMTQQRLFSSSPSAVINTTTTTTTTTSSSSFSLGDVNPQQKGCVILSFLHFVVQSLRDLARALFEGGEAARIASFYEVCARLSDSATRFVKCADEEKAASNEDDVILHLINDADVDDDNEEDDYVDNDDENGEIGNGCVVDDDDDKEECNDDVLRGKKADKEAIKRETSHQIMEAEQQKASKGGATRVIGQNVLELARLLAIVQRRRDLDKMRRSFSRVRVTQLAAHSLGLADGQNEPHTSMMPTMMMMQLLASDGWSCDAENMSATSPSQPHRPTNQSATDRGREERMTKLTESAQPIKSDPTNQISTLLQFMESHCN